MSFHNDKRLLLYYRRHTAHGLATHAVDAIVPEHDLIDTSPLITARITTQFLVVKSRALTYGPTHNPLPQRLHW
jgi:hypothetical protein